jgi:hypothetical protein
MQVKIDCRVGLDNKAMIRSQSDRLTDFCLKRTQSNEAHHPWAMDNMLAFLVELLRKVNRVASAARHTLSSRR